MGQYGWVLNQIDALLSNLGDPFLVVGKSLFVGLGALILLIYSSKWSVIAEESIGGLLHFVALLCVVGFMLGNFNTANPPPIGIGVPIKSLIPGVTSGLTDMLETSRFDEVEKRCGFIIDHLQSPEIDLWHGLVDFHALGVYCVVEIVMIILGMILMLPMMIGAVFLGIGTLLWPLFIPWLMVPRLSWLFWNMISFIIKYSFYRVFAIVITFIIAGVFIQLMDHALTLDVQKQIGGQMVEQYSLGQFTGLTLIAIVSIVPLCVWTIKELPNALRELFSGGAGAGASLMRDITSNVFKK
jgi:hypothetical protein